MRILRDPAATEAAGAGGVTNPAPGEDALQAAIAAYMAKQAKSAPGAESKPADDGFVRVKKEDYEALDALRKQREQEAAEARERAEKAAIKAGDFEKLWNELKAERATERSQAEDRDRKYRAAVRDREITAALAGMNLVEGGASQLLKLIRDEFEVQDNGVEYVVSHRTGDSVAESVRRMVGANFQHFVKATSKGGTGAEGGNRTTATPNDPAPAAEAPNLGLALVQHWQTEKAKAQSAVLPGSLPVGLSRRHRAN